MKNKIYIFLAVSTLALSSLLFIPALLKGPVPFVQAQSTGSFFDVFIEIDGVRGSTTNYPNTIDINSFSWGVNNSGMGSQGSGAGAGKVNMQDLSFTKRIDKSSPVLYSLFKSGKRTGNAVLSVGNGDGTYTQLSLSNVMVSGYGLSNSGDRPTESVTLNFSKITFSYDVKAAKK